MQSRHLRPTVVNDRPLNDVSGTVDAQARAPITMEERETKFAGVNIRTFFANAGDRMVAHKRCDIFDRNSE